MEKKIKRRERHTFTFAFEVCLLFEPKTSFPDFCGGVMLDSFSSSFPFSVGFSSCFVSSCSVDSVCVFPSKRFPDPVNGVNLGTLLAGSSSSTAMKQRRFIRGYYFQELDNFQLSTKTKPWRVRFFRGVSFCGFSGSL